MFKDVLKNMRKKKGVTQEALAKALGVTSASIGNYEQGTRMPRNQILQKIANYFNVSVDYLLENEKILSSNSELYYSYSTQKNKLIDLIESTDIPEEKIKLLINIVESWK